MKAPVLLTRVAASPNAALVARLNMLRWHLVRRWGWPGLVGLGLLVAALVVSWQMHARLEAEEQAMLRAKVAQLTSMQRLQATRIVASRRDPRDEARDGLPTLSERGAVVKKLLQQAEASGLALGRVDYVAQPEEPGLQRLRVTIPVSGDYAQLRRFVGRLLNQMPHIALDGLQLERPSDQPEQLNASMRVSVFFRGEPR